MYHAPRKILVFILWLWDKLRAKDIGKRNPSDARTVFKKLLCHNSKGLGEILEGGLVIAFGLICERQLHLELLAQPQDITLGDLIKLDFARHTPFVMQQILAIKVAFVQGWKWHYHSPPHHLWCGVFSQWSRGCLPLYHQVGRNSSKAA
jgi:hypothetical protein